MTQLFTPADLTRISHLQPDGWQDVMTFFGFYLEASFCLPLKIENRDRIVAVGSLILHEHTAWLAHIIVDPEIRRKGFGQAITEELTSAAEKRGRNIQLLIATEMGAPLYERFGFQRSCDYMFYHEPVHGAAYEPSQIRQLKPADVPEIFTLDRRASGEDRSTLVARYINSGWVYAGSERGKVRGFFLPKLGEGTIVAQDAEAGSALMKLRLAKTKTAPVLPAGNSAANRFLIDSGLKTRSSAVRMVRNGDDPLDHDMVFNRIGGHLG